MCLLKVYFFLFVCSSQVYDMFYFNYHFLRSTSLNMLNYILGMGARWLCSRTSERRTVQAQGGRKPIETPRILGYPARYIVLLCFGFLIHNA